MSESRNMYAPWLGEGTFDVAEEEKMLRGASPAVAAPEEPPPGTIDLSAMERALSTQNRPASARNLEELTPAEDDALFFRKQGEMIAEWAAELDALMKAPLEKRAELSLRLYLTMRRTSELMAAASMEILAKVTEAKAQR